MVIDYLMLVDQLLSNYCTDILFETGAKTPDSF